MLGAVALIVLGLVGPILLRSELWRACFGVPARAGLVLRWTGAAYALNQLVGCRSGDVLRVTLARRHCGVAGGVSSVGLLRAIEAAALLLVGGLFAAGALSHHRPALLLGGIGAVVALLALGWIAERLPKALAGSRRHLASALRSLRTLTLARLAGLLALAAVLVLVEAALFVGVALAIGWPIGLAEACTLLLAATLGQTLAFLPAGLLTYEASVAAAFALLGGAGAALVLLPLCTHVLRLAVAVCCLPLALSHRSSNPMPPWSPEGITP